MNHGAPPRRHTRVFALGLGSGVLVTLFIVALAAPVLAPYDPGAARYPSLDPPSRVHRLGTNGIGQDVLSQVIWGGRRSLTIGFGAASIAVILGAVVGVSSALVGGLYDAVAMRLVDVLLALPRLPILILIAAYIGPSTAVVLVLIGLTMWQVLTRVCHAETLSLRDSGYIDAAWALGGNTWYILSRHIVPALCPLLVAGFVSIAGTAIILETSLAFLGLSDPRAISWGGILNDALTYQGLFFTDAWVWWVLPAGFSIAVSVMAFAFVGMSIETTLESEPTSLVSRHA